MKPLFLFAGVLLFLWLAGVTVLAVWPVVADAPWEDGIDSQEAETLRHQNSFRKRMLSNRKRGMLLRLSRL